MGCDIHLITQIKKLAEKTIKDEKNSFTINEFGGTGLEVLLRKLGNGKWSIDTIISK